MKICFVILADYKVHNFARKIAFEINQNYRTRVIAAMLPQHVTLGPVFEVKDIYKVEEYFDVLAKEIEPFEIEFSKIDLKIAGSEDDGTGIIWIDVVENAELRSIHNRIYADIKESDWGTEPMSGAEAYYFHSTIALGGQPVSVYREAYESIKEKEVNLKCTAKEIAMVCPPDDTNTLGTYITYKILPLCSKEV
jgi:2'-5' RNA ligase